MLSNALALVSCDTKIAIPSQNLSMTRCQTTALRPARLILLLRVFL